MAKLNYGLIGYPLGHSFSPKIHKKLFELSGIDDNTADYSLFEIEPEKLRESYSFFDTLVGFNITIPHKIKIMDYCDAIDPEAEKLGAINCIYRKKGYNTDIYGLMKSLEKLGAPIKSKICVLGYGGAGRMTANALKNRGGDVTVAVRDPGKVEEKAGFEVKLLSELCGKFDLIINTTPLGMYPNIDNSPVSFENLRADYVLDEIFNPVKTLFLREAEKHGAKTLSGIDMLVWQAVRAHEIWHGGEYSKADINGLISEMKEYKG